jgi:hypothetical protein
MPTLMVEVVMLRRIDVNDGSAHQPHTQADIPRCYHPHCTTDKLRSAIICFIAYCARQHVSRPSIDARKDVHVTEEELAPLQFFQTPPLSACAHRPQMTAAVLAKSEWATTGWPNL